MQMLGAMYSEPTREASFLPPWEMPVAVASVPNGSNRPHRQWYPGQTFFEATFSSPSSRCPRGLGLIDG